MRRKTARAFTIVELLVVVTIVSLLVSLLLPSIQRARDRALVNQSLANLRGLGAANEAYAGDWNDRQFTTCPDDVGLAGGNCGQYLAQVACPPQQLIGRDTFGIWGYFIGSTGKCSQYGWPEACYNWPVYVPIQFGTAANPGGGSGFRLGPLDGRGHGAEGESHHRDQPHRSAHGQPLTGGGQPAGGQAHSGEAEVTGLIAAAQNRFQSLMGIQQGVVDQGGQVGPVAAAHASRG